MGFALVLPHPPRGPCPGELLPVRRQASFVDNLPAELPGAAGISDSRRVSTKGASSVMAIVCSEWAVREPSAERMVQPSGS